jgi:hypothetical protein
VKSPTEWLRSWARTRQVLDDRCSWPPRDDENDDSDPGGERAALKDVAEYAMFSRREMDRRYTLAQEEMAARGLDALILQGRKTSSTSRALARAWHFTTPGRARQRLFAEHVQPGMTERDVARTIRRLILEEGGDEPPSSICSSMRGAARTRSTTIGRCSEVTSSRWPPRTWACTRLTIPAWRPSDRPVPPRSAPTRRCWRSPEGWRTRCGRAFDARISTASPSRRSFDVGGVIDHPDRIPGGRFGHGQGMRLTEPPSVNPVITQC